LLERVQENALAQRLRDAGMRQRSVKVRYDGVVVGESSTDLLVEDVLLVELKTGEELGDLHRMRCTGYLKGTGLLLCPLLNFGKPRPQIKRVA
jgi:GxxExxY protein